MERERPRRDLKKGRRGVSFSLIPWTGNLYHYTRPESALPNADSLVDIHGAGILLPNHSSRMGIVDGVNTQRKPQSHHREMR